MWSLAGSLASFDSSSQRVSVDLDRPEDGMQLGKPGGTADSNRLQLFEVIGLRCERKEAYVRGDEAIATYQTTTRSRVTYRLVWQLLAANQSLGLPFGGVELTISAHTSQLMCEPGVDVRSQLQAASSTNHDGWFLYQLDGMPPYLEVVHPSNYRDSTQTRSPNGYSETTHHFFPGHLEKGVIRGARARGYFVSGPNFSAENAERVRGQLAESPPPLN